MAGVLKGAAALVAVAAAASSVLVAGAAPAAADCGTGPTSAIDCVSDQSETVRAFATDPTMYPTIYVAPSVTDTFPHLDADKIAEGMGAGSGGRFAVVPAATESPTELAEVMIEANPDIVVAAVFAWDGAEFAVGAATQPDDPYPGDVRAELLPSTVSDSLLAGEMAALDEPYSLLLKYASSGLKRSWVFYGYKPDPSVPGPEYVTALEGGQPNLVAPNNAMSETDTPVRVAFLPASQAEALMYRHNGTRAETAAFLRDLKKVEEPVVAYFVDADGEVVGVSTDGKIPVQGGGDGGDELARRANAAIGTTGPATFDALVKELGGPASDREPDNGGGSRALLYGGALGGLLLLLVAVAVIALRRRRSAPTAAAAAPDPAPADPAMEERRAKAHAAIDRIGAQLTGEEAPGSGAESREVAAALADYERLRAAADTAETAAELADLLIEVTEVQALLARRAEERSG
ncbi:hypothetical protein CLV63_114114 [Murinocardiopsis flavida]|uniref:DUF4350 domain-containing protein n=1 Tax=Murinocardiopsis flavida TaxID=645275 RepID=A0A2P8DEM3_9ACTN|nr:hypothetical protein [Murinocardiopsis flavida]PSK95681.1 hypothetical protein CLV63_114114 [Murinocardiopsis flavida]